MITLDTYKSDVECAWCPGCGNFGILQAVKRTLSELDIAPHQATMFTGIGQAPKLPHYMKINTFNGLHGREIAAAQGFRLVNLDQVVLVHGGEGGIYGEGGNHFVHAIRRNMDMTIVVHDNHIYGLTKGQASPTTERGEITSVNPRGVIADPLNPLALAISQSCSFVAQAYSADQEHTVQILKAAISHRGLSYVNLLQPCVTWDKHHTYTFFKTHTTKLGPGYDPRDRAAAMALVTDSDKLPLGVIYTNDRPAYDTYIDYKVTVDFGPEKMVKARQTLDRYR